MDAMPRGASTTSASTNTRTSPVACSGELRARVRLAEPADWQRRPFEQPDAVVAVDDRPHDVRRAVRGAVVEDQDLQVGQRFLCEQGLQARRHPCGFVPHRQEHGDRLGDGLDGDRRTAHAGAGWPRGARCRSPRPPIRRTSLRAAGVGSGAPGPQHPHVRHGDDPHGDPAVERDPGPVEEEGVGDDRGRERPQIEQRWRLRRSRGVGGAGRAAASSRTRPAASRGSWTPGLRRRAAARVRCG